MPGATMAIPVGTRLGHHDVTAANGGGGVPT